jgi:hypothetical protein
VLHCDQCAAGCEANTILHMNQHAWRQVILRWKYLLQFTDHEWYWKWCPFTCRHSRNGGNRSDLPFEAARWSATALWIANFLSVFPFGVTLCINSVPQRTPEEAIGRIKFGCTRWPVSTMRLCACFSSAKSPNDQIVNCVLRSLFHHDSYFEILASTSFQTRYFT